LAAAALGEFAEPAMADMPDVKITNARMVQMPNFRFVLPNSEIELSVHQQISSTTFDVASRYDMINTFFHIGFDLRYNFSRYFTGAALGDSIFFELNLGPKTYFQRTHNVVPYFGYNLGRFTEIKTAVSVGNTITASVDKNVEYDKGNVLVESVGIKYDTADPLIHVPNGTMLSCTLFGSYLGTGSDYEYTKGEINIKNTYMPLKWDYLESYFKFYFPMTTDVKPISDVYFAGGYEILRGYGFREFYGDTLAYGKLNYHIPIIRNAKKHALRAAFQILTIDITAETAQIGNAAEFGRYYSMKSSVSAGIGCDVVLFDHINLKFDAFSGKALEADRGAVLYVILTAYTYFEI
jgi:outer membrane protein assembly factor BamA